MPLSERVKNIISVLNGFRKYSIMLILVILGVVFRVLGYLSGAATVELLSGVSIAFMASNSVEHAAKGVMEWVKRKGG